MVVVAAVTVVVVMMAGVIVDNCSCSVGELGFMVRLLLLLLL